MNTLCCDFGWELDNYVCYLGHSKKERKEREQENKKDTNGKSENK